MPVCPDECLLHSVLRQVRVLQVKGAHSQKAAAVLFHEPADFRPAADRALAALENALDEQRASVYVYRESGDSQNHFTQKAKMWGANETLIGDMD